MVQICQYSEASPRPENIKVDPARAKTEAEAAVAAGTLTNSPDDDALVKRSVTGDDNNGLSIMSDWNEFRMSATMESV